MMKINQKFNQVIYISGPSIQPTIKEIKKNVQLVHEQISVACADGGIQTGTST